MMLRTETSTGASTALITGLAMVMCPWPVSVGFAQCETQQLTGSSGLEDDDFGRTISVSGDYLAVGDPNAELVFIYRREGGVWREVDSLASPMRDREDVFGVAVAMDGPVLVVGAHHASTPELWSGAAHVYRLTGDEWRLEQTLRASDGDELDRFGSSVAVMGDTAVVGARWDHHADVSDSGSAYVFRHDGDKWIQEAKLTDPEPVAAGLFGLSLSIWQHTVLIGELGDTHAGVNSGAAYVFCRDDRRWTLEQELTAFDASSSHWFGLSVGLAAEVAVIGAPQWDGQTGAAYVFRRAANRWTFEQQLVGSKPLGPFPFFGSKVAVEHGGTEILVAAVKDNLNAGAAYLFRFTEPRWSEVLKFAAAENDGYGIAVAIENDFGFVGAVGDSSGSGAVHVLSGMNGDDCNDNGVVDLCEIFDGTAVDQNGNGIPDRCETEGDVNGDGVTNVDDLIFVVTSWGACPIPCVGSCRADADGDCDVGVNDLIIVILNWD